MKARANFKNQYQNSTINLTEETENCYKQRRAVIMSMLLESNVQKAQFDFLMQVVVAHTNMESTD